MTTHLTNDGKNAVNIIGNGVVGPVQTLPLGYETHTRRGEEILRKLHAQSHANTLHASCTMHTADHDTHTNNSSESMP